MRVEWKGPPSPPPVEVGALKDAYGMLSAYPGRKGDPALDVAHSTGRGMLRSKSKWEKTDLNPRDRPVEEVEVRDAEEAEEAEEEERLRLPLMLPPLPVDDPLPVPVPDAVEELELPLLLTLLPSLSTWGGMAMFASLSTWRGMITLVLAGGGAVGPT